LGFVIVGESIYLFYKRYLKAKWNASDSYKGEINDKTMY